MGERPWTFVVLDKENKAIGLTETWVSCKVTHIAIQDDTGVLHENRGKGLGLMLKYQMLDKLLSDHRTETVRWWTTINAGSNAPMLRINDILKYETLSYYNRFEFDRQILEDQYLK